MYNAFSNCFTHWSFCRFSTATIFVTKVYGPRETNEYGISKEDPLTCPKKQIWNLYNTNTALILSPLFSQRQLHNNTQFVQIKAGSITNAKCYRMIVRISIFCSKLSFDESLERLYSGGSRCSQPSPTISHHRVTCNVCCTITRQEQYDVRHFLTCPKSTEGNVTWYCVTGYASTYSTESRDLTLTILNESLWGHEYGQK